MVDLGVDREATVFQTLDQVRLPQRPVPIEPRAVQPGRQLKQFANPARLRQGRPAQVVVDVDLVVEGPGHVGDTAEKPAGMLPERRLKVVVLDDRLVQLADEVGATALRGLEQLQPCNMHRVFTGFADEEQRIGWRYQFHRPDATHAAADSCKV